MTPLPIPIPEKQIPVEPAETVPWGMREMLLGTLAFALLYAALFAAALLIEHYSLNISQELWTGIGFNLEALLLIPLWALTMRKYRVGADALGLRKYRPDELGVGCGLIILAYFLIAIYSALLAKFNLRMQADMLPMMTSLSSPWAMLLGGALVTPFAEEVFFRGFIFAGLRSKFGWKKAALFSSILFAAAHLQLTFLVPGFLLGMILAYMYQRSRSIWPGIWMHIAINGFSLVASYLMAKGGPL